mgnify:FL=1
MPRERIVASLHYFRFLGTSGQAIANMKQYMVEEDELKLTELLLQLRHLAPTAPDTLGAYPFPNGTHKLRFIRVNDGYHHGTHRSYVCVCVRVCTRLGFLLAACQIADPFVIEACPHVCFIGNQTQFRFQHVEGM